MLEDIKKEISSSLLPLLSGIMEDSQLLMRQEIALVKTELNNEITKAKTKVTIYIVAGILSLVGCILFSLGLVDLLLWAFPALVAWQSYGIVSLGILLVAMITLKNATSNVALNNSKPAETTPKTNREILNGKYS